jgi:hypothetical protein
MFQNNLLSPSSDQIFHPEDGKKRFLQNDGKFLPYYMASHCRRK